MQPVLQDLFSQPQREHAAHALQNMLAARDAARANAPADAVATQLPDAVAASSDVASLSPSAQSVADLRAVIEQLNAAQAPAEVVDALTAVKQLVNDSTNAGLIGGALEELEHLADTVLGALKENPEALGRGFSFQFQADFSQQIVDSEQFYSNVTSFSFSFRFQTESSLLEGQMQFDESLQMNDQGLRYESAEQIRVGLVTYDVNLASNPALDAFVNLTRHLTGLDLGEAFKGAEATATPAVPVFGGGYVALDFMERLKLQLEQLTDLYQQQERLIGLLEQMAPDESSKAA